jgi:CubicO group peptidase (beta-lactamase class C family)
LVTRSVQAKIEPEIDRALQEILNDTRQSFSVVGVTMAVTLPQRVTWIGASGLSDQVAQRAMVPENLFRIASIPVYATIFLYLCFTQQSPPP